ncbi:Uncharacterised protein [Mycobacteroides abscessus subsp. abscessus]|nr:Uncharacterised protein [Mycobacteroides abscessus subsp. abscessus]
MIDGSRRRASFALCTSASARASSAALSPRRLAADFWAKSLSPFMTIFGRRLFAVSVAAFRSARASVVSSSMRWRFSIVSVFFASVSRDRLASSSAATISS